MSPSYLFSLAWLIRLFGDDLACYLSLVGRIGPGRAAYATVVFPIFALLISARYEGMNGRSRLWPAGAGRCWQSDHDRARD